MQPDAVTPHAVAPARPIDLFGLARAFRVDPDAWYSDPDLRLLFGVAGGTFTAARSVGLLRHTRIGKTAWHQGQWVIDRLSGKPGQPSARPGEEATHAAVA